MIWLPQSLFFDAYRDEPRFRALVEKLQFGAGDTRADHEGPAIGCLR